MLESLAFVAFVIPTFILLERAVPRERAPIRWRAIALAVGVLVINTIIARQIRFSPQVATSTASVLLAWFLTELFAYWLHRAMHRVPLLWRVHKMHHVPAQPLAWHQSWWINPLDIALFAVVASTACVIAGAPMTAAPWFLVVRRVWGILQHANVRWPATWIDHFIVTPAVHHRHHREELPPANFAGSFAIFDRVFGTWSR